MSPFIQTIGTAVAALAAVLAVVLLAGRGARALRLARPGPARRLVVREALAIDRTRQLLLVSCDGRELLLLTGGGDRVIGWLPPGDAP